MLAHSRMLRESAVATGTTIDLRAVTDPGVDSRLAGGAALLDLADAAVADGAVGDAPGDARSRVLSELGGEALVDAAGVIGNFEMMNRIADATGIPVGRGARRANADLIADLGLERYDHLD
ncbi:MAG: hypothetical protein ACE5GC_03740 [Acidimicrobiia bacterium]